jgi:hypothetical protein
VVEIVAVAEGLRRGASKRAFAGLAVIGVIAIAGLVAGWGASPIETVVMTAADVVALRFPTDWTDDDTTASTPPANTYGLASASADEPQALETKLLFSPYPSISPAPSTTGAGAAAGAVVAPQPAADKAPERNAALKSETRSEPRIQIKTEPKPLAVAFRAAEPRPAPRPRKDSGALFNEAQLASIKSRLKLTSSQEEYWPPVESALRDIGWKVTHDDRKTGARAGQALAGIDPDSSEVLRLKSAAFPLIMSMNEDQKREVRMLAQVMGLERVAASF